MVRPLIVWLCAALGAMAASPVSAACTFKVLPISVTMIGQRPTVAVKIGGQDRHFLIDSGSFTNGMSPTLASSQAVFLNAKQPGGVTPMIGAKGEKVFAPVVVVPQLQFVNTTFTRQLFTVMSGIGTLDGLIGQPMLGQMDVEYDLTGGLIRLVQTDGCKGTDMIYWAKDGQAYSKLSMAWRDRTDHHTVADVYINGQKMQATFDTGAPVSFITEAAAARAGVKVTDPGVVPAGTAGGIDGQFDAWVGTFAQVQIGDEKISNAHLEIGRSKAKAFDVLLGADFFQSHHVYVSNNQSKIFFTYEGGLPFKAAALTPARPLARAPASPPSSSIATLKLGHPDTTPASCLVITSCSAPERALANATDKPE